MTEVRAPLPKESVPRHVAVIMDGNGRWAQQRLLPRSMGHRAGVRSARKIVRAAATAGVEALTVYAFSQENWQRPAQEVSLLMQLFLRTLSKEIGALHKNRVVLRFIGAHHDFSTELRELMRRAEVLTQDNDGLKLVVAVGYGGQQDIVAAAARVAASGQPLTMETVAAHLTTCGLPEPDLMIRTGGEQRISNFLLWQLAYAELYFTDTLWPDFTDQHFNDALDWYANRQRRFGRVPEAS